MLKVRFSGSKILTGGLLRVMQAVPQSDEPLKMEDGFRIGSIVGRYR